MGSISTHTHRERERERERERKKGRKEVSRIKKKKADKNLVQVLEP